MKISTITPEELDSVVALFCECFRDDSYYKRTFTNPDTRVQDMAKAFTPCISHCLNKGISYGIYESSQLIGFIFLLDYFKTKANDEDKFLEIFGSTSMDALPYKDTLHKRVEGLGEDVLFCISLAVKEQRRKEGLASCLIDYVLSNHKDYALVADVSNSESLEIYRKRGFEVTNLDCGYDLVSLQKGGAECEIDFSSPIKLLVPDAESLREHGIDCKIIKQRVAICEHGVGSFGEFKYFEHTPNIISIGQLVSLDYQNLTKYQRLINLSQYDELVFADRLLYSLKSSYIHAPLYNETLLQMLPNRKSEWAIIPDTVVSVPVFYKSREMIESLAVPAEGAASTLLNSLDFRTHYEAGIPTKVRAVDELSGLKKRIKRYYLGKLHIRIFSETTAENYDTLGDPIGAPAQVDVYISVDTMSHCAVVCWYSLSCPFLISHYMDNVTRNQIMVLDGDELKNIYVYFDEKYGILKRGSAKTFVMVPDSTACLSDSQIASLLTAETIYPDGESFGAIIDEDIISVVQKPFGIGQYDRATVYAYDNMVLQFSRDLKGTVKQRLMEITITVLYIEWILFEEAAIAIADRDIIDLLSVEAIEDPVVFLKKVDAINDSYSRTIDFWDIRVNYPTSQKSLRVLRSAFKVDEQLSCMRRNQEQLGRVFDTKCDIIDRKETKRMDKSLAVLSVLAIFSAWIDSYDYTETWTDLLSPTAIHITQRILFVLILLIASYSILRMSIGALSSKIRKAKRAIDKRKSRRKDT